MSKFSTGNAGAPTGATSARCRKRRATLIATKVPGKSGALRWNVILQGRGETVFFDC